MRCCYKNKFLYFKISFQLGCSQHVHCLVCVQDHSKHCLFFKFSSLNSCRIFYSFFFNTHLREFQAVLPVNLPTAWIVQNHILKIWNFKFCFFKICIFFGYFFSRLAWGSNQSEWFPFSPLTAWLRSESYHQQYEIVSSCLYRAAELLVDLREC